MMKLTIHTDDLMTLSDAAEYLGVSRPTIYNMIERLTLHPVLIGRNRYLLRTEVEGIKKRG
jgi:excisionase family DNA binding protein